TALGALNGFGLFSQAWSRSTPWKPAAPALSHHSPFPRACGTAQLAVATHYHGMAVHEARKDVTPEVGRQAAGRGPAAASPWGSRGLIASPMPRVGTARSGSGLDDRLARSTRGPRGLRACTHKRGHEANVRSCAEPDPQQSSGRIRGTRFME